MKNLRLAQLFGIIMLSISLIGCSVLASPPTSTPTATQPPPTLTPLPPTNTPVPTDTPLPTETPTPAPTQSLNSMYKALRDVVDGKGVLDTAAYDKNKPGIHPIMLITQIDDVNKWNSKLPATWRPLNLSQTELVAQIAYQDVVVETDQQWFKKVGYVLFYRIRVDLDVVLREARTGEIVASTFFKGGDPPSFPMYPKQQAYYGDGIPYEVLIMWLKPYVEP